MKKLGLTQAELASLANMSQSGVARYLAGNIPKADHLLVLSNALGMGMEELLTGVKSKQVTVMAEESAQYLVKTKESKKFELLKRKVADLKSELRSIEKILEDE